LDAGIDVGSGVRAVDVFAEFQQNIEPFKRLVLQGIEQIDEHRSCTHCLPHEGVQLPFELP